jgi:hypothetical protein
MSATAAGLLVARRVEQDDALKSIDSDSELTPAQKQAERKKVVEKAETDRQGAFATLAAYIPSEGVTLYIAGVAAIQVTTLKDQPLSFWVLMAAAFVLAIALTTRSYFRAVTKDKPFRVSKFWWQIVITVAALALYITSIPTYPESPIKWDQAWVGLLAIIAAALLPVLAEVVGLTPTNPKKIEATKTS